MSSIAFYDHVVDRYITQSRRSSWEVRLENYRKWVRSNDQFTLATARSVAMGNLGQYFEEWAGPLVSAGVHLLLM